MRCIRNHLLRCSVTYLWRGKLWSIYQTCIEIPKLKRNKTSSIKRSAPFLWACGTDERLPRHFQSPTYVDPRPAQGLETPPRTSTSHLLRTLNADLHPLNTDSTQHGDLPRTEKLSTMEATRGNGYAPARGSLVMMMMMMMMIKRSPPPSVSIKAVPYMSAMALT